MNQKRILFVTQIYPSSGTGGTLKSRHLIEYLGKDCRYKIDVCCSKILHMANDKLTMPNVRIYSKVKTIPTRGSIAFYMGILVDLLQRKPFFMTRLYNKNLRSVIRSLLHSHIYDEVILDGFSSLQYADLFTQSITYSEINDMTPLLYNRARTSQSFGKKIFFYLEWWKCAQYEKKHISRIHTIWTIRPESLTRYRKITKASIYVIPITIPFFPYIFRPKSNHVVFSGLLQWKENVDGIRWFLETCWMKIHAKFPNTYLYITGQLADISVQKKIKEYPNVVYCGYMRQLSHIYKECACAITPIFIDDGIKMKTLSYIGHGLPVVSGVESTMGMISTDGILLSSRANFADSVITLLQQKQLRTFMSKRGYQNARINFSINKLRIFFTHNEICKS